MKYLLLIYHGTTPLPGTDEWNALSQEEQGYFLSLGSSSSSPKWAGKDDVLYSIDYQRGIDILQWKGKHYVPGKRERNKKRGTNGVTKPQAPTQAQAAQRAALARELHAQGWSPLICSLVARDG